MVILLLTLTLFLTFFPENFEQAVQDYKASLALKVDMLGNDDRQLAEAHYKLAVALEYTPSSSEAVTQVEKAMAVLRNRLAVLDKTAEADTDDEKALHAEMREINSLFPEMEAKVCFLSFCAGTAKFSA